jgi:lipopolysaccharide heptosyltransferase II
MVYSELVWKRILGNVVDFMGRYLYRLLVWIGLAENEKADLTSITPRKILIIRTDSLGDVVLATPFFRAVKQKYPRARISVLIRAGFKEVLVDNPHVDQVITHDVPWNKERAAWPAKLRILFSAETLGYPVKLFRIVRRLRSQGFDLGIDLNGDWRNILFFLVAAGARYRLSFNRTGGEYFLTDFAEYDVTKNQLENNMSLLRKLGIGKAETRMEIFVSPAVQKEAEELLKRNGIRNGERLVLLHPGGKRIQRWPAENFALLGKRLAEEFDFKLVLTGTRSDLALMTNMRSVLDGQAVSLIGKTSIRQLAALLARDVLLICNDTGVMHIASAMNCDTLAIFGPTNPRAFAHPNIEVIQKRTPCSLYTHEKCSRQNSLPGACMSEMTVDFVYERVQDFLRRKIVT